MNDTYEIWIITGLSQKPNADPIYYWRFKNHKKILNHFIKCNFTVFPRMTRDFEIFANNNEDLNLIEDFLINANTVSDRGSHKAFSYIDRNEKSIFASFVLDSEKSNAKLKWMNKEIILDGNLDFIAKKSGQHDEKGWAFCNKNLKKDLKLLPIWDLPNLIYK